MLITTCKTLMMILILVSIIIIIIILWPPKWTDIHRDFFPNAKICHRCTQVPGINETKDDDDDDDDDDVNGNSKSNWNCSNYKLKLHRYTSIDIISWGLHLAVPPKPLSSMIVFSDSIPWLSLHLMNKSSSFFYEILLP